MPSLEKFARLVRTVAQDMVQHPGWAWAVRGERIFVHAVWMRGPFDSSLDEFKRSLIAAHQARLLTLSRADLVEAMDHREVRKAEISYLSARFHFVEAVGVSE